MTERLAFLGMGMMGAPMARNLLRAGYAVTVWNRTAAKAEALVSGGATDTPGAAKVTEAPGAGKVTEAPGAGKAAVAASPAEAAREADIVLACLFDAEAVEQVLTGPEGVLEGIRPGSVFIDHTTNSPPVSRRLAGLLAERGAAMLDAPVSGGDVGAIEGALSIMVGGDLEAFERCRPVLAAMGSRVTLMGEAVGAGGHAKLANQIMVAIHLAAMGEALVFGAKAGLDLNQLVTALSGGVAASAAMDLWVKKVLRGDFSPGGEARVLLKDLTYIKQAMDDLGFSLPLAETLRGMFAELVELGHGLENPSAIIRLAERAAGVEARG